MNPACQSEPISFLRLERYLQGDGSRGERERVASHLAQCELCRGCFEALQREVIELAPLPEGLHALAPGPVRGWAARVRRAWPPLTAALALAAVVALWVRDPGRPATLPGARAAIKGGELALELVREHAGTTLADSDRFASGDRLQLHVSCPPTHAPYWDVVVFQGGQAFFPITPVSRLSCDNRVTLPGAFTLDDASRAEVCVVTAGETPPSRARLRERSGVTRFASACLMLEPVSAVGR